MSTPPTKPEGVHVLLPDRSLIPELAYVGQIDGIHTWDIMLPDGIAFAPGLPNLTIAKLPASTAVRIPVTHIQ